MYPDEKLTLRGLLDREAHENQLAVRTVIPANVLSYDPSSQTASLQLSTKGTVILDDGRTVTQPALVLNDVPVIWPSGGGGYVHTGLSPGDTGAALVCDRSNSHWRQTGKPSEPAHPFPHNLGDCVFLPGLRPDISRLTPAPYPVGTTIEGSSINLGSSAALGVARQTDAVAADANFAAFSAQVVAAIVEIQATLTALGKPPAAPAPAPIVAGSDIALIRQSSSKVRAE